MRETKLLNNVSRSEFKTANVFVAAETGPENRIQAESDAPLLKV
ncbi:unnamed protein product [Cylicostephanus goldi]|uniref:Uncharacterized protein n=1 Tax=Cylicostephanus goldi TaxID=71465 RepID=A0A3P7QG62_CYLGO|nr:unnamed protein product [Cylicostephanus goldi]